MRRLSRSLIVFAIVCAATPLLRAQTSTTANRAQLEKNKDVVERYFTLADKGDVEGVRKIVSSDYIEHASYAADGRDALLKSIAANVGTTETGVRREKSDAIRMLAEGDQVWVYTRVRAAGTLMARMNMFRLENSQIAEHWAVQEVTNLNRQNENDQWAVGKGPQNADAQPKRVTKAVSAEQLAKNKDVMRKFFLYSESNDPAERIKLLQWATTGPGGYIQHNANAQDGIEAFAGARAGGGARGGGPLPHHELVRVVAEGDYVWCVNIPNFANGSAQGPERANANQWRIQGDKLAEHWATYETVQAVRANTNDFFGFGRMQARDLTR